MAGDSRHCFGWECFGVMIFGFHAALVAGRGRGGGQGGGGTVGKMGDSFFHRWGRGWGRSRDLGAAVYFYPAGVVEMLGGGAWVGVPVERGWPASFHRHRS